MGGVRECVPRRDSVRVGELNNADRPPPRGRVPRSLLRAGLAQQAEGGGLVPSRLLGARAGMWVLSGLGGACTLSSRLAGLGLHGRSGRRRPVDSASAAAGPAPHGEQTRMSCGSVSPQSPEQQRGADASVHAGSCAKNQPRRTARGSRNHRAAFHLLLSKAAAPASRRDGKGQSSPLRPGWLGLGASARRPRPCAVGGCVGAWVGKGLGPQKQPMKGGGRERPAWAPLLPAFHAPHRAACFSVL